MAQQEIEVILVRQLASYLAMPMVIVDPAGTLLFYNEPAEELLGMRFEETGELTQDEWVDDLGLTDEQGMPVAPEARPLVIALNERRPAHKTMWGQSRDGVRRHVEVTAFPLIGQAGRALGAVAIFWEVKQA
jgi:PAS domain S-box-containing protein